MQQAPLRSGAWSVCSHDVVVGGSVAGGKALMESKELRSSFVPHSAAKICSGTDNNPVLLQDGHEQLAVLCHMIIYSAPGKSFDMS